MDGSAQRRAGLFEVQGQPWWASGVGRRDHENARVSFLSLFWKGNLEGEELRQFYRLASTVYFCAGETICSEGEYAASVFGLAKGHVRLHKNTPDDRRQIVSFALPGDFLCMPLAEWQSCSADAIDQVVLCRFPRTAFTNLVQTAPNSMRRLIDFEAGEREGTMRLATLLGHASAEQRLRTFLIDWRNRLARLGPPSQFVPLPMMRQDIADFLGLTPETVSRTLAKLEAKKLIRVVPKGVVLNGLDRPTALPGAMKLG